MSKIPFTDYFKMRSFVLENLFHETLDLEQMYAVGQATASDDDFLTLYHLTPKLFLEQGCRLVGRTSIECCPDIQALQIANSLCSFFRETGIRTPLFFVDLFAGSGNLLYHLCDTSIVGGVGIEADPYVYSATKENFTRLAIPINIFRPEEDYLRKIPKDVPVVFVIDPSWGNAFSPECGLDLNRTNPPILETLTQITRLPITNPKYALVKTTEMVEPNSVESIEKKFRIIFESRTTGIKSGINNCFFVCRIDGKAFQPFIAENHLL